MSTEARALSGNRQLTKVEWGYFALGILVTIAIHVVSLKQGWLERGTASRYPLLFLVFTLIQFVSWMRPGAGVPARLAERSVYALIRAAAIGAVITAITMAAD